MKSRSPKVLQPLAGRHLLAHVIDAANTLDPARIHVVYGHGGAEVKAAFNGVDVNWVEQSEQLGTGHAVLQAMPDIPDDAQVLVLYGDVPLTSKDTLNSLVEGASGNVGAILSIRLPDPSGYGRIVRQEGGALSHIVEQKDASNDELAIDEVNTGLVVFAANRLRSWLDQLGNNNAQGEYYLTDVAGLAVAQGESIALVQAEQEYEVLGVNDRRQLSRLERIYQSMQAENLMTQGLHLYDPNRFDLRGQLSVGRDVRIDVDVVIEGTVTLGEGVQIGPFCRIKNALIGAGTKIESHTVIEDAEIGEHCSIGPYARLRPETVLAEGARIGNFVEIKKTRMGHGSKANHLAYVGDAEVGADVNIGAGVITCNYDGANKHKTVIGDGAFIGSDSQLVAPVEIGAGATIGAGTTVTKKAPDDALTISRSRQTAIPGWQRPQKDQK